MTVKAQSRPRDLRLDFFRGLAMFIILIAHIPWNKWALWIPARFGFSDATEMFVFCSGMASAIAFGTVFAKRGVLLGTARILFRIWQVYWAQIGTFLATVGLLALIDRAGIGLAGKTYLAELPLGPFLSDPAGALLGLLSLTWVPAAFDILPMYLVILALIPVVMVLHREGGAVLALGAVVALWAVAQTGVLDLPARPDDPAAVWFFNPFAWSLVFFTGFAFGSGWLPAPPVRRWLIRLAAGYVILSIPLAWHRLWGGILIPEGWALQVALSDLRWTIEPLVWKTWIGAARYLHFLALAYLAWVAVGPGGIRLRQGFRAPGKPGPAVQWAAAILAVLTVPWAWVREIAEYLPGLDAFFRHHLSVTARDLVGVDLLLPVERITIPQVLHLACLLLLLWAALGPDRRNFACGPGFVRAVPLIAKVGTQSLAVFMVSIVLAQACGWLLDLLGRAMWSYTVVNLGGIATLVGVAYAVGWFKGQPWSKPAGEPQGRGAVISGPVPTAAE